ncbi:septal ring lytic transglycosylase RlpA family protein [Parvularcula marina]|uniref:septal ring lytic transglycosylase RlpA family protein n=1 Tax=Parvularcula marina TaxID=2292771 RepID=UPI003513F3E7
MFARHFRQFFSLLLVTSLLAACGTTSKVDPKTGTSPSPRQAKATPHEKIGNPYYVSGIRYIPKDEPGYVKTGLASWYGPKFHGRLTANGEIFDQERLTAAHKTLPLPSLVRVTNLENGRTAVVRLNDRGPFSGERIIDLSKKTAETLDMKDKGLANVRVEYLGKASLNDAIVKVGLPENYAALKSPLPEIIDTPSVVMAHAAPNRSEVPETIAVEAAPMAVPASYEDPIAIVVSGESLPSAANVPISPVVESDIGPIAYFVQVGVFSDPQNAASAAGKFDDIVPMSLETVAVSGETRQRLRIGPYVHEFAAEAAMREAIAQGFEDAHIVRGGVLF